MSTPITNRADALRIRLFAWVAGLIAGLTSLSSVMAWLAWGDSAMFALLTYGLGMTGLVVWHRQRPALWIRWLFVLSVVLITTISDSPAQVLEGRSTVVFVFPPILAAISLSARAAGVVTMVELAMMVILSVASGAPLNFYALLPGLTLSLLIVLFANSFEGLLEQLTVINLELEDRVRQRTSELQVAMEKIQMLDSQRVKFLSVVSHELRAPLNNILGFAQLMMKPETEKRYGPRSAELISDVRRISGNAKSLLGLVGEILDLAKMEAGHFKIEPKPAPIIELALTTADEFQAQAEMKSIQFVAERVGEEDFEMSVDSLRFIQVMRNLLSNAFKFTPEGGCITVRAGRVRPDCFEVSVSDTGPGIAREHQQGIFEPFRQAGGKSLMTGGTGLGLPICKHIIELHGGQLKLESAEGVGTTFRVQLPVTVDEENRCQK